MKKGLTGSIFGCHLLLKIGCGPDSGLDKAIIQVKRKIYGWNGTRSALCRILKYFQSICDDYRPAKCIYRHFSCFVNFGLGPGSARYRAEILTI